ncbi:MAG: CbiX/SirB N-terminal domain-containing protein [Burkholderiales bacterium]|nr:CbiX/SirB N-terminal domain-containing protein [Burkholderiales bacterium]MCL4687050.1 CbiX/SirB N-terminal domain-containing protein [Burkholderiales bacterium]
MHGIVLFAHGARDPEWARPFEGIRDRIRARRPEFPVELAFLDFMSPRLDEAVECLVRRGVAAITIFPLFMAPGGHIRNDLPRIAEDLRKAHPGIPIAVRTAIGEAPELLDAIAGWILGGVD